jgi:hypothetical protein
MAQKITGGTTGLQTESPVTVSESALMRDKTSQKPVVPARKMKREKGRKMGGRK